jgi:hypothetical protein
MPRNKSSAKDSEVVRTYTLRLVGEDVDTGLSGRIFISVMYYCLSLKIFIDQTFTKKCLLLDKLRDRTSCNLYIGILFVFSQSARRKTFNRNLIRFGIPKVRGTHGSRLVELPAIQKMIQRELDASAAGRRLGIRSMKDQLRVVYHDNATR